MMIKNKALFFLSFTMLCICLAGIFFQPFNEIILKVDRQISLWINPTLAEKNLWTMFWGAMNKTVERYISIAIMLIIAITFICRSKDKRLAISLVFSMILYLEIATIIKFFIVKFFEVNRLSPSNVIEDYNLLSKLLNDRTIKDGSGSSFPGDHALVLFFIAFYSQYFYPKMLRLSTWFFALFFVIPRVVSGAHWASDIVGTMVISFFYANLIVLTPIHDKTVSFIKCLIKKCSRSSVG